MAWPGPIPASESSDQNVSAVGNFPSVSFDALRNESKGPLTAPGT